MGFLAVIVAGVAAWIFGAVWYGVFAKPWLSDVGLTEETIDRKNPIPYIFSFVAAIFVAGMMRHTFIGTGVDTVGKGLISGLGLGLFIAVPWLATNYMYAQRPNRLILIDGGYATGGSAVIGMVLMLFGT